MSIPMRLGHGQNIQAVGSKIDEIIEHLHRAKAVGGLGIHLRETASGTVIEVERRGVVPTDGASVETPLFAVTVNDDGLLDVSPGYLNRNGIYFGLVAEKKDIEPEDGVLCLCSVPDEDGVWSEPEYKICTPGPSAYPIAAIKVEETESEEGGEPIVTVTVTQYQVTVAAILLTKLCPLAEF